MAPRRRAAESEEDEEQEQETTLQVLKFDEPLSWRPGSSIPAEQLLKRLDRLSKELSDMEQESVDTESLNKVAKDLAHARLLNHKDKGVRAFTASCVVEILRLYAPNAPYTPSQLKDIFNLIISVIIPAVLDPANPYSNAHKFVIQSLTEVKSIVILNELDVDGAETLMVKLFQNIFDGVSGSKNNSGEQLAKDVEFMLQDMLSIIIEEAAGLPPKVVDIIMAQFLRAATPGGADKHDSAAVDEAQATLLLKEEPEAYVMAKHLCQTFPEKMSRFVGQYFADVIMDANAFTQGKSNGHRDDSEDEDEEDGASGPSDSDLKELRKAHRLIREVWKAAPAVLQNVVPQVEGELSTPNVQWRQLAVETLGDMISGIGAAGPPIHPTLDAAAYPPLSLDDDGQAESPAVNILKTPLSSVSFSQSHPGTFFQFMNRKKDKAAAIRASWTTSVGHILATSAGGIGLSREEENALIQGLTENLFDADEKVRLAAVKAIESFKFGDIILKLGAGGGVAKDGSVLHALAERIRDKKPAVRVAAMSLMAKLWAVGTGELLAGNEAVTRALDGIPSRIVNCIYANDPELNVLIDRVIFEFLVPVSYPPTKKGKSTNANSQSQSASFDPDAVRAERILLLIRSLDEQAKKAFFALYIRRQPQLAEVIKTYVANCEAYNGGVMDADRAQRTSNLERSAKYIAQFLPDHDKAKLDLMRFAKINDRRYYHLIKFFISQESDFSTAHKALKELIKRIQGSKDGGILETLLPIFYRASFFLFNRSHLATILEYSRSDKHGMATVAHEILNELSQHNPDLFKTHIGQLCKDLVDQAPSATRENDLAVVETLKACASYCRKYPKEITMDRPFTQALINYALYGRPIKAAKYAVSILLSKKDEKSMVNATDLIQKTMKDWTYGSANFLNKLTIVGQLELLAPKVTDEYEDAILNMTVQQILMEVRIEASGKDPVWVDDADMDEECQAKCLALRILVNRLRASEGSSESKEHSSSVWKLLRTLVKDRGELCKTRDTPQHHKARLRLLAAQYILKLCIQRQFDDLLTPQGFNALAFTTQDAVEQVRHHFVRKLQKYLSGRQLRARFYTIVFLTAFEPNKEFKTSVEHWIRSRVRHFQDAKQPVFEPIVARLLSLLAHHPDFSTEVDDLVDHARYLIFYMTLVADEDNLGVISKYAERVKQTQDAIDPTSENHRIMSDLAQAVIRKWQEKKNWVFNVYSGKIGIPVGLYKALQSHDEAQEIAEKQYIPDGVEEKLDEVIRVLDRKKKRKSTDDGYEAHPPAKKARSTAKPSQPKEPKGTKVTVKKAFPKPKKTPSKPKKKETASSSMADSERRRSGRSRGNQSYMERDDSEDDEEMLEGVAEWEYLSGSEAENGTNGPETRDSEAEPSDDDEGDGQDEPQGTTKTTKSRDPVPANKTRNGRDDEDSELSDVESLPDPNEDDDVDDGDAMPSPKATNGKKSRAAASLPRGKTAASRASRAAKNTVPSRSSARPSRSKRKQQADEVDMEEEETDD